MHANAQPNVTVVIPAYNGSRFIQQAIESCLGQSDSTFSVDVVVVDDASTDNTRQIVRQATGPVTLLQHETNLGRHVARNNGLAAATGEFVKFLDQDDFLEPATLRAEYQLAVETQADITIAGHRTIRYDDDGRMHVVSEHLTAPEMEPRIPAILDGKAVPTAAALYRRAYINGLTWDGSVPRLDDWDWFIRAALRMGTIAAINHVSYSWRKHPQQYTHRSTLHQYACDHHVILDKIETWLQDHDEYNASHKARLAQYYYKMLRAIYKFDRRWHHDTLRHIFQLDPAFFPYCEPRSDVRRLCRILGVHTGLFFYNHVADAVHGIRSLIRFPKQSLQAN